ncbi:MAG: hypothetical protein KY433_04930 [Actinobacteria bacterium]|nr:hypothetical protein [Actinomycetota bacterium]
MLDNARMIATLVAAGALLAAPTAGLAAKGDHASGKTNGKAKNCKTHSVGYQVSGTLVSVTADDAATPANEAAITLKVTAANSHAAKSGEIDDQNATKKGVQVKGATLTIAATDTFTLKLKGYEGTDTPSVGDRVKVSGKIKLTKKRCAPAGTSTADRYATPDIKKVTLTDRDADA